MNKHVILITGTPCIGKTSVAQKLASKLNATYINLTELAEKHENLILGRDRKRNSIIVNEEQMRRKISQIIQKNNETFIIDGHYAANVVPKKLVTHIIVLRRDPAELQRFMEKNGFSGNKLWENLAAEILDVILVETLKSQEQKKVCELDVTGKSVDETIDEILDYLDGKKRCHLGVVDWLSKLEKEGTLENLLKI